MHTKSDEPGQSIEEYSGSDTAESMSLPKALMPDTVGFPGTNTPSAIISSRPTHFADYEILAEIAHGGMGIVYRARQISLNRTVALKMIRTGEFASDEEGQRFQSEAEAAAMLQHPHIVSIYEIGTQPGRQYFSMQLIEGGSLATALQKGLWIVNNKESGRRAAQLLATVARAVHYAHQRGILHRDLKPGNILLDGQDQPFVTDFGLAKRVEGDSALTQSGHIVGTASYMSPEQASAARKLTTAADIYSLGAILYELLTARPPHRGDSLLDTLVLVRQQEPARPRTINPGVDFDLETICLKCLEKDPARRYGSAEAVAEDLERWLHYEPIRARRSTLWERAAKWTRRQPVIAALTALILLLSLAGFGAVTLAWQDAAVARDTAEQAEKDKEQQRRVAVEAQGKAEQARDDEKQQRQQADDAKRQEQEQRRKFQRLYVEQLLDKVANLNDKKEAAHAALWLARGLQTVSADDGDLDRILRANLGETRSQLPPLVAMLAHQKIVRVAALSGDGKRVLTGGADTTVCLWELETGKLLTTLKHDHGVNAAAFSPDDKFVATAAFKAVQFWDRDGKSIGTRLDHPTWVGRVMFSPDGKKLLSYDADRTVRLWNIEDAEATQLIGAIRNDLKQASDHNIFGMAFSPNSKLVATVGRDGFAQVWVAATAQPFGPPLHQKKQLVGALFRGNNDLVLGGDDGLTFHVVGKEQAPQAITGVGAITTMEYSPEVKLLATGGFDSTARIYSGTAVRATLNHNDRVRALAFSPDGKMLLTGSDDQKVRFWESESGLPLGIPLSLPCPVQKVAVSQDGKTVLAQGPDKVVRLWQVPGPDALRPLLPQDSGGVQAVAYSSDGKRVAAAVGAGGMSIRVWDTETGELVWLNRGMDKPFKSLAFHPDGQILLTAGADKTARLWDIKTRKEIGKPCEQKVGINQVIFRPDGRAFVTIANRSFGTAQLWDTSTQEPMGKPMFKAAHTGGAIQP